MGHVVRHQGPVPRPLRAHASLPQRKDVAVLVAGATRGNQRSAPRGALNHDRGGREAGQNPVAGRKHPSLHLHARRLLGHHEPTGFHDGFGQAAVDARMDGLHAARQHRHLPLRRRSVQHALMGAAVDATRQPADHRAPCFRPFAPSLKRPRRPLGGARTGANHRQRPPPCLLGGPRTEGIQDRGRVAQVRQELGVTGVLNRDHMGARTSGAVALFPGAGPGRTGLGGVTVRPLAPRLAHVSCLLDFSLDQDRPCPGSSQQRHPGLFVCHALQACGGRSMAASLFTAEGVCFAHVKKIGEMCCYLDSCDDISWPRCSP